MRKNQTCLSCQGGNPEGPACAGKAVLALAVVIFGLALWPAFSFAEGASKVQEQRFFESLNDVPLMPGLYEMLDESVVFDKPDGRIVESAAASEDVAGEEIRAFYSSTLPQMGWIRKAEGTFVREGESLTMNIENREGYNIVRFTVSPR